jgi:hypothetical protein
MNQTGRSRQSKIYGLTFLFLVIGLVDFWMMNITMMVVSLGILALLNIGRLFILPRRNPVMIDVSIQVSNAIMTGAAAYVYHQTGNTYSKWLWGILSFFFLVLSLLTLLGGSDKRFSK